MPAEMPAEENAIFISYRRSDSRVWTERIYDHLEKHFGHDVVFKDVGSIPTGEDFPTYINQTAGCCQVLIAVIGLTWAQILAERDSEPQDWVRAEIEMALSRVIPVVPLLVDGACLPGEDALPQGMKALAKRNADDILPDPRFKDDITRLINRLEQIVGTPSVSAKNLGEGSLQVPDDLSEDEDIQLVEALISAFPSKEALSLMVKRSLKRNLNLITQEASLYETTVTRLVEWTKAQGELQALMEGALKRNPGNPKLKALVKIWSQ